MSLQPSFFEHLADRLELAVYDTNQEFRMSAIDRLKAKALQARGIAPKAIADFEKDLDTLIAEGPKLEQERVAAVSVHHEAFTGIRGEIGGLRDAMDILSNGGPALDPLPESGGVATASAAELSADDIHNRRDRPR